MAAPIASFSLDDLRGDPRRLRKDRFFHGFFFSAAMTSLVVTIGIVYVLVSESLPFFTGIDWSVVFQGNWSPLDDVYGIYPLLYGSVAITTIAIAVAVPVGLGAAIYLSEFASPRVRRTVKPILEVIAGIPSVVVGFFALQWISPNIVGIFNEGAGRSGNFVAAGLGVGLLSIPLMASISEDAMRSVPGALREASAGLGAKKLSTTIRVVLPAAISGLVAALIITISRALGETMVVFIAAGAADNAQYDADIFGRGLTLPAAMASIAGGTGDASGAEFTKSSLYFIGVILFVLTFFLNVVAGRFVRRFRQAY